MILARLDLKAFGRFRDVSLDLSAGPRRFHLIYGPNESGKSTSLRAITSLLFGMETATDDCFAHRPPQIRVGGLLLDSESGAQLECVRRRGRKGTLRDSADKDPIDEAQLAAMLGGITRETFQARFGLSYEALVEGGNAILQGGGDLGQILFAAGAGVERLRDIQKELDEGTAQLFTSRGTKSTINSALKNLEDDRKALREAQVPVASFVQIREQLDAKQREADQLGDSLRDCLVNLTRLQALRTALPLLPTWFAAHDGLANVAGVPSLDDDFTERRRQLQSAREIAAGQQQELDSRLGEMKARLDSFGADPAVMRREMEIQKVFQEIPVREQSSRERLELSRSLQALDREIASLLSQLSVEVPSAEQGADVDAIGESIERLQVHDALRVRIRELAAKHAGLVTRRNDASDMVETAKRRLADLTQELESLGDVVDPAPLAAVIESIGNPETEMESLLSCRQNCERLRERCEAALQRLEGYRGDLEQAVRLNLPGDASVQKLADDLRTTLDDVTQQESSLRQLLVEHETVHQQLLESQAERSLPTLAELQAVREDRDRITDQLVDDARSGNVAVDVVEKLRDRMHQSDRISDTMREHSEHLHRRETLTSQLNRIDQRVREAKANLSGAQERLELARSAWTAVWASCHVSAGQPDAMRQWRSNHEKLCDLMTQLESEEKRLEQIESRVGRATRRLRNAMQTVATEETVRAAAYQAELFEDPPEDDLVSLYDEAVAIRSRRALERQQYDAVRQRRDELAEELPQVETRFEAAQQALEDWHKDWRRVTESFVNSDHVGAEEVLMMLDQIGNLNQLKQKRDETVARIRAIDEDEQSYGQLVERLAKAVDQDLSDHSSFTSTAHAMYQRLQAERKAVQSRLALQEEIELASQQLTKALAQRSEADRLLAQLCSEAGCESPEELPEIETKSREKNRLQVSIENVRDQLMRLAGDLDLDAFIELARAQQPAILEVEIEREDERQADLKKRIEAVQREIGATQYELNQINGGSAASDLAQSMQLTAGMIRGDIERYARLKIGTLILNRAIEHYRQENQSPVLVLANRYFRQLTCGEYTELNPDFDQAGNSTLFGVNSIGEQVPVTGMSTGTADSLYLALRLASLQHQMNHGKAIPVVIDDCLIQLDDDRATAALQAFSDLSEKTQVILFTHHQHLCQLAREHLGEGQFHLHQLGV